MAPVAVLAPQPGDRVLDLCAAPGGKTTQIQSWMGNRGILIANDPNPKRVQALCRNLERWGTRNAAVLCETPPRISQHLREYFDRVLVDAPCSATGVMRRHPEIRINHLHDFVCRSKAFDEWRTGSDVHFWSKDLQAEPPDLIHDPLD